MKLYLSKEQRYLLVEALEGLIEKKKINIQTAPEKLKNPEEYKESKEVVIQNAEMFISHLQVKDYE